MKNLITPNLHGRAMSAAAFATLALCLAGPFVAPVSAKSAKEPFNEAWPGRRVVFLLPLQLGDKWNANAVWGQQVLVPLAQHRLRGALEATGKFSVMQPFRFDPMLQRAMQEKLIDKAVIEDLIATPTIQTANDVLEKLGYKENDAFIVEVALTELTASGDAKTPLVQMQVTGKLFGLKSQSAKESTARSDSTRRLTTQDAQVIDAAGNAFAIMATEFVRAPADVPLPRIEPAPTPVVKPVVKPVKPAVKPAIVPAPAPKPAPAPTGKQPFKR